METLPPGGLEEYNFSHYIFTLKAPFTVNTDALILLLFKRLLI